MQRRNVITIRLSDKEYVLFAEVAKSFGMSVSAAARHLFAEAAEKKSNTKGKAKVKP